MRPTASLQAVSDCITLEDDTHHDRGDNINFCMVKDNLFLRVLWWDKKHSQLCDRTYHFKAVPSSNLSLSSDEESITLYGITDLRQD
jgi:hypothetical protein